RLGQPGEELAVRVDVDELAVDVLVDLERGVELGVAGVHVHRLVHRRGHEGAAALGRPPGPRLAEPARPPDLPPPEREAGARAEGSGRAQQLASADRKVGPPSCPHAPSLLWATPPFMTKSTRRSAVMSRRGSPSTPIRSARLPGSMVPTSPATRHASAPHRVPARSAFPGVTPKRTSVSSSYGRSPCMLSVPTAKRIPDPRTRGKFRLTTSRAQRTFST